MEFHVPYHEIFAFDMKIFSLEGFRRHMRSQHASRLMGIDYGTKKIGISISDESQQQAFPYQHDYVMKQSLERTDAIKHASDYFSRVIVDYDIGGVVVGFPLHDGKLTPLCHQIIDFIQHVTVPDGVISTMWDEHETTVAARAHLKNLSGRQSVFMKNKDKVAATFILQSYLNYYRKAT